MDKCYTVTRLGKKDARVYEQLGNALVYVMQNVLKEGDGRVKISKRQYSRVLFKTEHTVFVIEEHLLS